MTARLAPHPFLEQDWQQFGQLLRTLNSQQVHWLSLYLTETLSQSTPSAATAEPEVPAVHRHRYAVSVMQVPQVTDQPFRATAEEQADRVWQ